MVIGDNPDKHGGIGGDIGEHEERPRWTGTLGLKIYSNT